jgi:tRNA uracil 4-sulfurtransferase
VSSVIVHYGELALKGRNRPWFVSMLVRTIRLLLADQDLKDVRFVLGRLEIQLGPSSDWTEIKARLSRLPGIGNFSRATHVALDLDAIGDAIVKAVAGRPRKTFRIAARRADKRFPHPSPDIERVIGRRVQEATGWPVDLENPELKIFVETLAAEAFYYFDKEPGSGGLPVGTSGKVMCLLSGGIDSPVAAWRLIRRGCRAQFVHFHSYPILSSTSQDKVREIAGILTQRQLRSRLYLVPFGPVQQQVVVSVPPPIRVVVYRRLMVRIAEQLALRSRAQALITGDVLGQVASQTIDNLEVVGSVATMPLLRPLIGCDKDEITTEAQRLGTYETSIIPDEDCCTLFTPRFPTTRATRANVETAEAELDVAGLVQAAVDAAVVEDFRYPMVQSSVPSERPTRA